MPILSTHRIGDVRKGTSFLFYCLELFNQSITPSLIACANCV